MLKFAVIPPPLPPGEDELPCDDGAPLESERHRLGITLLVQPLVHWLARRGISDVYVGGNMAVYYSQLQVLKNDFRAPDVFVALDAVVRERKSWVTWMEGHAPDVVIELVSESTAHEDRGRKKRIYAHGMRVGYYFVYDPFDTLLEAWRLDSATHEYVAAPVSADLVAGGPLGLELGVWTGVYEGVLAPWLRWREAGGAWLPTPQESAAEAESNLLAAEASLSVAEAQRAEAEAQRAEAEAQRVEAEAQRAEAEARAAALEQRLQRAMAALAAAGIRDT